MPVANFYINEPPDKPVFQAIVKEWANELDLKEVDITLNLISGFNQIGHNYTVMAHLFLPSIWSQPEIEKIQQSLFELLITHLKIDATEIFIMTSIIKSGNVLRNSEVEKWE